MDELKVRAGEKLEALHVAAKTAADTGKNRAEDIYVHTADALRRIREAFNEIWQHELIIESRARVSAFVADTVRRVKEGTPPLSPVLLYEELKALFKDRVWRRSAALFLGGVACGTVAGFALGVRVRTAPSGLTARALISHPDTAVMLVEDAFVPAARAGEVLVRVQSFSVDSIDRAVLRGHGSLLRALLFNNHLTIGRGFAGVVLDVGPGVTQFELGDEVWGCVSEWGGGAAAELLTIRSTRISKRPRSLTADVAASLVYSGAQCVLALDRLKLTVDNCKGKRVAILGASCGVGCCLVRVLSARGATVCVTVPRVGSMALKDLGATHIIEPINSQTSVTWTAVETYCGSQGPWDAVLVCPGSCCPSGWGRSVRALLKATAPRSSTVDLRPHAFISDRLPLPFSVVYGVSLYGIRAIRCIFGCGLNTDWLEDQHFLTEGLDIVRKMVDSGELEPVLDKVFLPQDFESALAHACSDDAIGTTVIRFP